MPKTSEISALSGVDAYPPVIDLRSDTVTRPSPEMLEAMVAAPLGDDVYGGDPTVQALEAKGAKLLGKGAGLYCSSATQTNLLALLAHCQRGEEYIAGDAYHVYCDEAGGAAVLGGISPCPIPTAEDGRIDPERVRAAIKEDDFHYPITRLLCLENTVSGRVIPREDMAALIGVAKEHGLSVHLDGARLLNASTALGLAPAEIAEGCDSVTLCLSKGLGCPIGSLLLGSSEFIHRARRLRKLVGGGMRQVGVLAACGLVALEKNIERLAEDHANARRLAEGLSGIPTLGVDRDLVETNMVFVEPQPEDHGGTAPVSPI